jgi:hypothetical protein
VDPEQPTAALLEADQGDIITGKLSREQAAATVAACLQLPEAAFKTFELRASEASDAQGRAMAGADYRRMALGLALGEPRARAGGLLAAGPCTLLLWWSAQRPGHQLWRGVVSC